MLGELVGEGRGKVTGVRVLSIDGMNSKVEASFQGQGTILGKAMTEFGTYTQVNRPGGMAFAEGKNLIQTTDGEIAPWQGFAVARLTGEGLGENSAVAGAFHGASAGLDRLNRAAYVTEFEADTEGNYHYRTWEWLGPNQKE